MKTLPFLRAEFASPIAPGELPAFYAALTDHLGFTGNTLFEAQWATAAELTQGVGQAEPHRRPTLKYPFLQLKLRYRGQQHRPLLLYFGERIPAVVQALQAYQEAGISIGQRYFPLRIQEYQLRAFPAPRPQPPFAYRLFQYLPCAPQNLGAYQEAPDLLRRRELVERLLYNHLMAFAEAVGYAGPAPELRNVRYLRQRTLRRDGRRLPCFDLQFEATLSLPPFIGLGHKAEVGHGVVSLSAGK